MTNNTLLANVPVDLMYPALETQKGEVQIYTHRHRHCEGEPAL